MELHELANGILDRIDPDKGCRLDPQDGGSWFIINPDKVDALTEELVSVVAEIVATITNAGSEREAVMENEQLHRVIREELVEWSTPPTN